MEGCRTPAKVRLDHRTRAFSGTAPFLFLFCSEGKRESAVGRRAHRIKNIRGVGQSTRRTPFARREPLMRRKLIVTVVQLLVVQVFIAAGVANAQNKKVACVGDSITAPTNGWCSFMGMKLGSGYTAQTFGVSGTTLLKNVGQPAFSSSNQFKPSHDFAPNIVVIMLGTNDSMSRNWSAGKDHFVKDYEELIDSYTSLASKPTVFLNTVPPASDDNMFTISGTTIEKEINPLVKQVAMNKMCPVVDVWEALGGDVDKLGSFDGVHPGSEGSKIIGETVAMAILMPPSIPSGTAGMAGSAGSVSGAAGAGQAGMSANAAGAGAAGQTAATPSTGGSGAAAAGSGAAMAASAGRGAVAPVTPSGNTSSTSSMTAAPGAAGAGVTANAAGSTGTAVNPVTGDTSAPMTAGEAEASGCSCHAAGSSTSKSGPMAALFLLVAIVIRSRRRITIA
jgi:MYXO-CTERM domain-containing protein